MKSYQFTLFTVIIVLNSFAVLAQKENKILSTIHLSDGSILKGEEVDIPASKAIMSHVNWGIGAHVSFGHDFEYDFSIDYLRRIRPRDFIGLGISYESFFEHNRQISGRVEGQFYTLSLVYEHLFLQSVRNGYSIIKAGYGFPRKEGQYSYRSLPNNGFYSQVLMGYRFKNSGDIRIGIEGGVTYQFTSGNATDPFGQSVTITHHFVKPALSFVFTFQ